MGHTPSATVKTGIAPNSVTEEVEVWLLLAALTFALVVLYGRACPPPLDFGMFYTAKQIYLHNGPEQLYNLDLQRQFEKQTYNIPDASLAQRFIPYNHLPYEVVLWIPLDRLSASQALWAWRVISFILLLTAILFFRTMLATRFRFWQLMLIALAFFPVPYCLLFGQDTFVTLALVVFGFGLLNEKLDFLAGAVLALGLFKWQLVLPIVGIFFLRRAWKIVAGFVASASVLLAISTIMVGAKSMLSLLHLWRIGEQGAIACINPRTMPNVRGLLSVLPGAPGSLVFVGTLAVSVVLLGLVVYQLRSVTSTAEMLALAICFVPLVSFHTALYDLALLIVPILVLFDNWSGLSDYRWTRRLLLFLLFNPLLYFAIIISPWYPLFCLVPVVGLLWFCLRVSHDSRNSGSTLGMNSVGFTNQWTAKLTRHIPPGQFGRYLLVGAWNTLFGYGSYAFFTAILSPLIPHSYIAACVISSLLNISVSYLGYKWFVFKTKGNYLREWIRCVGVYSGGIVFGVVTLPVLVAIIRHNTRFVAEAPYIAGAFLTAFMVVYSFVGHKKFSFRSPA